jgi:predicted transposase/invertase (TIGR01784 family)
MTDQENTIEVFNPHDKLFREIYGDKENARSFLTGYLPGKVLDLMDMSTLEISKDSFIEKNLEPVFFHTGKTR